MIQHTCATDRIPYKHLISILINLNQCGYQMYEILTVLSLNIFFHIQFGLKTCEDTVIGQNISGGEIKRLAFAAGVCLPPHTH